MSVFPPDGHSKGRGLICLLGPGVLQAWPRVDDQSPFAEWKWDSNEAVTSSLQEQAEQGGFL